MWHEHVSPLKSLSMSSFCILVTWPYHRTLRYFTLNPATRLSHSLSSGNVERLAESIEHWRVARAQELEFVCKASTVSAAAAIGIFSWNNMDDSYWLGRAFLYFSLSLSLGAVITSAQQFSVINAFPPYSHLHHTAAVILRRKKENRSVEQRSFAELNMLYVWQCPLMLMSYAWVTLVLALTLHVCSPLINQNEDGDRKVAYFYLGTGLALVLNFIWSSAWVYWTAPEGGDDQADVAEKQDGWSAGRLSTASTLTRAATSNRSPTTMTKAMTTDPLRSTYKV